MQLRREQTDYSRFLTWEQKQVIINNLQAGILSKADALKIMKDYHDSFILAPPSEESKCNSPAGFLNGRILPKITKKANKQSK